MSLRRERLLVTTNPTPPKEPAISTGITVTAVFGLINLINVFFPNLLTDKEQILFIVVSTFLLPIITSIFTRGKVWSPASVKEILNEAVTEAEEAIKQSPYYNEPKVVKIQDAKEV